MSPLSTEQRGEGFAFFRWHMLRWPEWCYCKQDENFLCVRIWRNEVRYGR